MFAIETEIGRFEAETEKEAKRLLRKAEKEHAKREAIDKANLELARMKSAQKALRWFRVKFEDSTYGHVWIIRDGDAHFPVERIGEYGHSRYRVFVDNNHNVSLELNCYRPIAVQLRSDGDVELLWTQCTFDDSIHCMAIGYHENMVDCEHMPSWLTVEFCSQFE